MAVGSHTRSSEKSHKKAEVFSHSTSSWKAKASYSFHEAIWDFEIVAFSDSFILFGGMFDDKPDDEQFGLTETGIVAKFHPDSNKWKKIGNLQHSRHGLGVIKDDTKYLVMGGYGYKSTETCELKNETMGCTSREPTLNQFRYYPAMMLVASDYANNC